MLNRQGPCPWGIRSVLRVASQDLVRGEWQNTKVLTSLILLAVSVPSHLFSYRT
jgi:hypothetical protein